MVNQFKSQPWYIGHLDPFVRGNYIFNYFKGYNFFLEIDFNRYDAHQHGGLLRVEKMLISRILGADFAEFWERMVH